MAAQCSSLVNQRKSKSEREMQQLHSCMGFVSRTIACSGMATH
uniref:Uncharacterized protein n=1 Tax=Anguilla anguilla TaxID=7936 RepID=A0A0E9VA58_ANGAN